MPSKPIINVHTHIFSLKDVPRYVAKQFVPTFMVRLTNIHWIGRRYTYYNDKVKPKFYQLRDWRTRFLALNNAIRWRSIMWSVMAMILLLIAIVFLTDILGFNINEEIKDWPVFIVQPLAWLVSFVSSIWMFPKVIITLAIAFFSKTARKVLLFLGKTISKWFSWVDEAKKFEFLKRYIHLIRYATYADQKKTFDRLYKLYDIDSKFVVLTMDMEYMDAGAPERTYLEQLDDVITIIENKQKNSKNLIPFLFVDPRRIGKIERTSLVAESNIKIKYDHNKPFFEWDLEDGQVVLRNCLVRDYLDGKEAVFKGIKIYPALGYYVFDERLIPLWAYCEQHGIPITTHCIEGTIFYRGKIKKADFQHPVFTLNEDDQVTPLMNYTHRNYDLQKNWTHPLNYLVLLEPELFMKYLNKCSRSIQEIFEFDSSTNTIQRNLSELKINLGHYGGSAEWKKYWERDRQEEAAELKEMPDTGIYFIGPQSDIDRTKPINLNKPGRLWSMNVDWFSIISSLMLQYKNVYADISYTLHNDDTLPLLLTALENDKLAEKILFGTDFYVVRNHRSERELFDKLSAFLGNSNMNKIAIGNPEQFLGSAFLDRDDFWKD